MRGQLTFWAPQRSGGHRHDNCSISVRGHFTSWSYQRETWIHTSSSSSFPLFLNVPANPCLCFAQGHISKNCWRMLEARECTDCVYISTRNHICSTFELLCVVFITLLGHFLFAAYDLTILRSNIFIDVYNKFIHIKYKLKWVVILYCQSAGFLWALPRKWLNTLYTYTFLLFFPLSGPLPWPANPRLWMGFSLHSLYFWGGGCMLLRLISQMGWQHCIGGGFKSSWVTKEVETAVCTLSAKKKREKAGWLKRWKRSKM